MDEGLTVPATVADISDQWLSAALTPHGGLPVQVSGFEVEPVGVGVGVMALLHRLVPTYAQGTGPKSVVVKMSSQYEPIRQVALGYRFYEREVGVYQQLAPELSLRSPTCHYAEHDPATDNFALVMEDLSDRRMCDQITGCPVEDAHQVIGQLADLHAQWFGNPRLLDYPFIERPSDPPYPQYHAQATKADWPVFLERFGDHVPTALHRIGERWSEIGPALMEETAKHPWTLAHGDVRLDNLFFGNAGASGDSGLRIVDWQICYRNQGAFDLAYFMGQSLTVEDRRAHESELLHRYHDRLRAGGVTDYGFDELFEDYRRSVLFSFCYPMSAGANADLVSDRVTDLVHAMIDRSVAAIDDLDATQLIVD